MFRNDPDFGAIPAVGKGTVDIGRRTLVGEAVVYDGTDPDALISFLGDAAIRNVAGELYQASEDGVLTPMVKLRLPAIVVRPPAGDWFTINEDQLRQEYAIHVNVVKTAASFTQTPMPTTKSAPPSHPGSAQPGPKASPKKAAAKKAAATKK